MGGLTVPTKYAYRTYQVLGDENPPTLNTLHEVFEATGGVELESVYVVQTNTPTNMEEIDIVITKDGTAYTYDASVVGQLTHNQEYAVIIYGLGAVAYPVYIPDITVLDSKVISQNLQAGPPVTSEGGSFSGHTIKVEIRQTSAIAAGARVRTKCTYHVLEVV